MKNQDRITDTESLFKSVERGLLEAIAYERGEPVAVKIDKIVVSSLNTYVKDD